MYRFQFTYLKESYYNSIILIDKYSESFLMVSPVSKVMMVFDMFSSVTVKFLIRLL